MSFKIKEIDRIEILSLQDNYIDIAAFDSTEIVQRAKSVKDMEAKVSILAEHGFSAIVTVTAIHDISQCQATTCFRRLSDEFSAYNMRCWIHLSKLFRRCCDCIRICQLPKGIWKKSAMQR